MISRIAISAALAVAVLFGAGIGSASASVPPPSVTAARPTAFPGGASSGMRAPSTNANPGEDIRDIHGPLDVPGRVPIWWYVAAAGAVLVAAQGMAVYARRRKRRAPPHTRALRALTELRSTPGTDGRTFSFAVSEIVRLYVEEAFRVRAAHRTTEELLSDLMLDNSPISSHRVAVGEFLNHCDLAKFGGWSLSEVDMTALLESAETLVLATMPNPPRNDVRGAAVRAEGVA
jgi:hypothetical protein